MVIEEYGKHDTNVPHIECGYWSILRFSTSSEGPFRPTSCYISKHYLHAELQVDLFLMGLIIAWAI